MNKPEFENRLSAKDKIIRRHEATRLKILDRINNALAHADGQQAIINAVYYDDCPACYHAGVASMFCQMCFGDGKVLATDSTKQKGQA